MNKVFSIMISIFLPIFILLTVSYLSVFNLNYYEKKFVQYEIEKVTGKDLNELIVITNQLFSYFKDDDVILHGREKFNEREIIHMKDVKEVFKKGMFLRDISFIISLISFLFLFLKNRICLKKSILWSSSISIFILSILFVFYYIDFDKYFTYFHLVLFDNNCWLLDPNEDLLIQMFPLEFFVDIFNKIILLFLTIMSILLIIAVIKYIRKEG